MGRCSRSTTPARSLSWPQMGRNGAFTRSRLRRASGEAVAVFLVGPSPGRAVGPAGPRAVVRASRPDRAGARAAGSGRDGSLHSLQLLRSVAKPVPDHGAGLLGSALHD